MSKSEELFAMGRELGEGWREDADPIQVEWLKECCNTFGLDMTDWRDVVGAILPGEIQREEISPAEAWSEITGESYALLEARHPQFVAGFVDGALAVVA